MTNRDGFVFALKQRVGKPYIYGGVGPVGYDCSGLVIACLNDAGIPTGRTTAQGLYILYHNCPVDRLQAPPGSLYFYGDGIHLITHVMTVVEHWDDSGIVLVGARGGDAKTVIPSIAESEKAFVDAVWGDYWLSKFVCAVDPFQNI